jgi:hypothetical protein
LKWIADGVFRAISVPSLSSRSGGELMGTLLGLILVIALSWILAGFATNWLINWLLKRFTFFTDETDFEAAQLMNEERRKKWTSSSH